MKNVHVVDDKCIGHSLVYFEKPQLSLHDYAHEIDVFSEC